MWSCIFPPSVRTKCRRRVVVCCTVLLATKLDEISIILEQFMTLVPTLPTRLDRVLPDDKVIEVDDTKIARNLHGGD